MKRFTKRFAKKLLRIFEDKNFMAQDIEGYVYLYGFKPDLEVDCFEEDPFDYIFIVRKMKEYRKGWRKSLIVI